MEPVFKSCESLECPFSIRMCSENCAAWLTKEEWLMQRGAKAEQIEAGDDEIGICWLVWK